MKSMILILFNIKGIPFPFKIISKNEPSKNQIIEKLRDIMETFELGSEIEYLHMKQEKNLKGYMFNIGDKEVLVTVERLEVMEFPK